LFYLTTNPA